MIKAVLFDTFGTIVDWRSSIARESAVLANAHDIANFDGDEFARTWRAGYRPGMAKVTAGERSMSFTVNGLTKFYPNLVYQCWVRLNGIILTGPGTA